VTTDLFIIVDTDNFGGDYPDENCLTWTNADGRTTRAAFRKDKAEAVAKLFNDQFGGSRSPRFFEVRPSDYKLQPGFEP